MFGHYCALIVLFLASWVLGQDAWLLRCMYATDVCPNAKITFWLYKNESGWDPVQLHPLQLKPELFKPKLPLKILIHGFVGNRNLTPNLEVRDVLLRTQHVHVVSVDYGDLVRFPCYYPWAVQNAPIVAKCLAQFIDALLETGIYTREQIHLIGFSLGAQIAGLAANRTQTQLKRITGLDPAGPGFMFNTPAERLDSSDAEFVDVIHTDPFLFSLPQPMGHVDFYPNLKHMNQLGCNYISNWRFYNCNHYRAAIYYAESLVSERGFWAQHCTGWMEYLMQRCNLYAARPHMQMGYFVPEHANGSYFLTTNAAAPYARGPMIDFEMDVIVENENEVK